MKWPPNGSRISVVDSRAPEPLCDRWRSSIPRSPRRQHQPDRSRPDCRNPRVVSSAGVPAADIGVIAPYRAQVAEISKRLPDVTVDTVDRFQGSSKEVIVISFVATGRSTARSSRITGVSTSHSRGRRRRSSSSATATRWRPTRCTVGWSSGRGADYASASPLSPVRSPATCAVSRSRACL